MVLPSCDDIFLKWTTQLADNMFRIEGDCLCPRLNQQKIMFLRCAGHCSSLPSPGERSKSRTFLLKMLKSRVPASWKKKKKWQDVRQLALESQERGLRGRTGGRQVADWSKGSTVPPAIPSVLCEDRCPPLLFEHTQPPWQVSSPSASGAACQGPRLLCIKGWRQGRGGCKSFSLFLIKKATIKPAARGMGVWGSAGMRLMIAYFTQAAVVASQLAGAAHRGFKSGASAANKNNANQGGASRMLLDVKQLRQEPRPGVTWKKAAMAKQHYRRLVKTKQE